MILHDPFASSPTTSSSAGKIAAMRTQLSKPRFCAKVKMAMHVPTDSRGTVSSIKRGEATL